jgi:hypothetical protein
MRWVVTNKADQRPRRVADGHYSRQRPGHPMWTRPGWTQILYIRQRNGRQAAWCWWRPKWEAGIERKDGLRAIECTIFRNLTRFRSSDLIDHAVAAVLTWEHAKDTSWPDGLITSVNSIATAGGRHVDSLPGHCFRSAGWVEFPHAVGRADVWLRCGRVDRDAEAPLKRQGTLAIREAA